MSAHSPFYPGLLTRFLVALAVGVWAVLMTRLVMFLAGVQG